MLDGARAQVVNAIESLTSIKTIEGIKILLREGFTP